MELFCVINNIVKCVEALPDQGVVTVFVEALP